MNVPTKKQLKEMLVELTKQNEELYAKAHEEEIRLWWKKAPDAILKFWEAINNAYGNNVRNVVLDHIDESGYYFSYQLTNDPARQIYAVRHTDL